jgi:hypothetical protein
MEMLLKRARNSADNATTPAENEELNRLTGKTQLISDKCVEAALNDPSPSSSDSCSYPASSNPSNANSSPATSLEGDALLQYIQKLEGDALLQFIQNSAGQHPMAPATDNGPASVNLDWANLPPLQGGVEDSDMLDLNGVQPWDSDMVQQMLEEASTNPNFGAFGTVDVPDPNLPWPLGSYAQPPLNGDSFPPAPEAPSPQSWEGFLGL